jgi:hypothetical protein
MYGQGYRNRIGCGTWSEYLSFRRSTQVPGGDLLTC